MFKSLLSRTFLFSIQCLIGLFTLSGCFIDFEDPATLSTTSSSVASQVIISGPQQINVNACQAYTAQSVNPSNVLVPVVNNTTVNLSGAGGGQFYSDPFCTTPISSVSIPSGGSSASFFYMNPTSQLVNLTATDPSGVLAGNALSVNVDQATQLSLTGNGTIGVVSCQPYTVTSLNSVNNPFPVSSNLLVNLSGVGSGSFYSDPGCGSPITTTTIPTGSSSSTVYFSDPNVETVTLTASDPSSVLTPSNLNVNVIGPTQLSVTGPSAINVGSCQPYTVQSVDASNIPVSVGVNTNVILSGNGLGQFHSNPSCSSPTSSVVIPAGSSSQTFYFIDPSSETVNLTGTDGSGVLGADTQNVVVTGPSQLAIIGPTSVSTGTCQAFTVQAQDSASNAMNVGSNTLVNLGGVGSGSFFSDAGCSLSTTSTVISAGTSSQVVYFRDLTTETLTLTATDTSSALTGASHPLNVVGPTQLAVLLASPSQVGACVPVSVISQDSASNPFNVPVNTTLNMTSTGSGSFFSDPSCSFTTTSATIASGNNSTLLYYRDVTPGSYTITATDPGAGLTPGNAPLVLNGPTGLTITGPTPINVGECRPYTVSSVDGSGTVSAVGANTTVTLSSGSASALFYSDVGCTSVTTSTVIPAGSSSQIVYLKDTVAESLTLTASDLSLTLGNATTPVVVNGPTQIVFSGPTSISSGSCNAYSVNSQDGSGNNINVATNTIVNLSQTGSGTFFSDPSCGVATTNVTIPAGSSTGIFYLLDNVVETTTLSGVDSTTSLPISNYPVTVTGATQLVVTGPTTGNVGACLAYTVTAQDASSTPLAVASPVTVNLSQPGSAVFYSDPSCSTTTTAATIPTGSSFTNFYVIDTVAESVLLSANDASGTLGGGSINLVTSGPSQLAITGASPIAAGSCQPYTVQSLDVGNNPLAVGSNTLVNLSQTGGGVFYSDPSCLIATTNTTIPAGSSSSVVYLKDNLNETITLTAADSLSTLVSGTLPVVVNGAQQLVINGPNPVVANTCNLYTVQSQNSGGTPINVGTNTVVSLSDPNGGTFFSDASCTVAVTTATILTGTSSAQFFYQTSTPGNTTLTGTSPPLNPASTPIVVNPPVAVNTVVNGPTTPAPNTCVAYTFQLINSNTNAPTTLPTNTTYNLSGNGSGSYFSDPSCGTGTTSLTIPAGSTTGIVYYRNPNLESVVLTGTPTTTPPGPGSLPVTVQNSTPINTVVNGPTTPAPNTCVAYTFQLVDSGTSLPTTLPTNVVYNLSGNGSGSYFSDPSCGTGTTSLTIPAGSTTGIVYYRNPNPESVVLTGTPTTTPPGPGSLPVTVQTTTPSVTTILNGPTSPVVNACTAYNLQLVNTGTTTPATLPNNVTYALTNPGGTGVFFSDPTCTTVATSVTLASGTSNVPFYYRTTSSGPSNLVATPPTNPPSTATFPINGSGGLAMTLTGLTTANVGQCVPFTLTTVDGAGNPTPVTTPTPLNFAASPGGLTFFTDPTCTTIATGATLSPGSTGITCYLISNTAQTVTVTVTDLTGTRSPVTTNTTFTGAPNACNLDPNFGSAGISVTQFGSAVGNLLDSVVLPNNQILVAGRLQHTSGDYDFALARYLSNGAIDDSSFGVSSTGLTLTDFSNTDDTATGIALQSNGSIVLAGTATNGVNSDIALARFTSGGVLDTSFGTSGRVLLNFGGNEEINDIEIDVLDRIYVIGTSGNSVFVARFLSNGSLDNSFAGTGVRAITPITGAIEGHGLTVLPTGGVIGTGTTNGDIFVVKMLANGNADTSFDGDGISVVPVSTGLDVGYEVTVQADGKIVVVGEAVNIGSGFGSFLVMRYLANGALDTSFDGDGIVVTQILSQESMAHDVHVDAAGIIYVAGHTHESGQVDRFVLAKYNADGSLNAACGNGGIFTITNGTAYSMSIDSAGNPILVGDSVGRFALGKFN